MLVYASMLGNVFLLIITFLSFRKIRKLNIQNSETSNINELKQAYLETSHDIVFLKDENLRYIFVNKNFEKFNKIESSKIIGHDDYDFVDEETANFYRMVDKEVLDKRTIIVKEAKSDNIVLRTTKFPVKLLNDKYGVGAYVEDVTEEYNNKRQVAYLSYHDSLTGLYNRRFFEEELSRLDVERNLPISIIVGDMNGLKLTNDIFGHAVGDQLLQNAAKILKTYCRADDIIARMGGDEFTILLPKTTEKEARGIITRVKKEFSKERTNAIKGSMSMGCDTKLFPHEDIYSIIKNAEKYMYTTKSIESREVKFTTINTIIETLHLNSIREKEHSKNVGLMCENIGKALNLPEIDIRRLKEAGFLHDIGKITLNERIINGSDVITEQDIKEIKQHPTTGYRILKLFDDKVDLAEGVLNHHEKWDGSGYPKGLKGEEIPILARIISVAEAYDALTNPHSKNRISKEEAIEAISKESGKSFDPEIVNVLINMVTEKPSSKLA